MALVCTPEEYATRSSTINSHNDTSTLASTSRAPLLLSPWSATKQGSLDSFVVGRPPPEVHPPPPRLIRQESCSPAGRTMKEDLGRWKRLEDVGRQ